MARGRPRMVRGRPRMVRGRPRMARSSRHLRMARIHLRMTMAIYGRRGFSLQVIHGWRESPIGSRNAAMYHCTSKWERGPPLPDRPRMAHWSSADGSTGARTGGELSGAHWDHRAQSVESFPGRASCAGFTGAFCGWRTVRCVGSGQDRRISALRIRTSRCSSRHPSWSLPVVAE